MTLFFCYWLDPPKFLRIQLTPVHEGQSAGIQ